MGVVAGIADRCWQSEEIQLLEVVDELLPVIQIMFRPFVYWCVRTGGSATWRI